MDAIDKLKLRIVKLIQQRNAMERRLNYLSEKGTTRPSRLGYRVYQLEKANDALLIENLNLRDQINELNCKPKNKRPLTTCDL